MALDAVAFDPVLARALELTDYGLATTVVPLPVVLLKLLRLAFRSRTKR
jgi:hypothetical protein